MQRPNVRLLKCQLAMFASGAQQLPSGTGTSNLAPVELSTISTTPARRAKARYRTPSLTARVRAVAKG